MQSDAVQAKEARTGRQGTVVVGEKHSQPPRRVAATAGSAGAVSINHGINALAAC